MSHGILGQTFDNDEWAVDGAKDKYNLTPGSETTTTAQGEGAIEGTHTDYLLAFPFATDFKYSRFGTNAYKGRDISMLKGKKRRAAKLFADNMAPEAGASELHARVVPATCPRASRAPGSCVCLC